MKMDSRGIPGEVGDNLRHNPTIAGIIPGGFPTRPGNLLT
jgi:hypothetical protein